MVSAPCEPMASSLGVAVSMREEGSVLPEPSGLNFIDLPEGAVHSVFSYLGPRDLFRASSVCTHWRDLCGTMCNQVQGWQAEYSSKMRGSRVFGSKALVDVLYGHSGAVTSLALLPACNLIATGSADCTVRLWDLQAGLPMSTSRHLKGTVRALAMDERLLVSGGSHDGAMRIWRSRGSASDTQFELGSTVRLQAHSGPIVSLSLDARYIYSCSWDHSVRIWNRDTLCRVSLLAMPDWVSCAKPRGGHLLVTAGSTLHVHSLATGQCVSRYKHTAAAGSELASSSPLQVEGSRDGRMAFLGGADGAITALDLRAPKQPVGVLWNQSSPIRGLSFEDPWLAAATYDQSALLIDIEAALTAGLHGGGVSPAASSIRGSSTGTVRQRLAGPGGPVCCVDIADRWLACGAMDPVVRTWDFQQAGRAALRPRTAPRRPRGSRRARNRFAFTPDSEDEEDENCNEAPSGSEVDAHISLSQSLPANMGGKVGVPPGTSATRETHDSEADETGSCLSAQGTSIDISSDVESEGAGMAEPAQLDSKSPEGGLAITKRRAEASGASAADFSNIAIGTFGKGALGGQRIAVPPPIGFRVSSRADPPRSSPVSSMHSWRIRRPRRRGEHDQDYREAVETVG